MNHISTKIMLTQERLKNLTTSTLVAFISIHILTQHQDNTNPKSTTVETSTIATQKDTIDRLNKLRGKIKQASSRGSRNISDDESDAIILEANAVSIALSTIDKSRDAIALLHDAATLLFDIRPSASLSILSSAEEICRSTNDHHALINNIQNQMLSRNSISRYKESINIYENSRDMIDSKGSTAEVASCAKTYGDALLNLSRHDEALAQYNRSRSLFREANDENGIASVALSYGLALNSLSRFGAARRQFTIARTAFSKLGDELGVAYAESNIGILLSRLGHQDQAIAKFDRSEEIYRKLGREDDVADSLRSKGNAYLRMHQYDLGIESYRESEGIYKSLNNEVAAATISLNISIALTDIGKYSSSLSILNRIVPIFRKNGTTRNLGLALRSRSEILERRGLYSKALKDINRAIKYFKESNDSSGYAFSMATRGEIYHSLYRTDDALHEYRQAELVFKGLDDEINPTLLMLKRAKIAGDRLDTTKALKLFQKTEEALHRLKDKPNLAHLHLHRGVLHANIAHLAQALQEYHQADLLFQETSDNIGLAKVALHTGQLFIALSRPLEALKEFDRAELMLRETEAHQERANVSGARGNALRALSRYDEAVEAYSGAAERFEELGKIGALGTIFNIKGTIFSDQNRFTESMKSYDKAISHFTKSGSARSIAHVLCNQAALLSKLNKNNDALGKLRQAQNIIVNSFDWGTRARIECLRGLLLRKLLRPRESITSYARSLEFYEKVTIGLGKENSKAWRGGRSWLPRSIAKIVLGLSQSKRTSADVAVAFRAIESIFGRTISERLQDSSHERISDSFSRLDRDRISEIRTKRAKLLDVRNRKDHEEIDQERKNLDEAIHSLLTDERRIVEKYRLIDSIQVNARYPVAADATTIQSALPRKSAIITICHDEVLSWAFISQPEKPLHMINLGTPKTIVAKIQDVVEHFQVERERQVAPRTSSLRDLGRLVLDPILLHLNGSGDSRLERLFFSVHGDLARIPMEILLTRDVLEETATSELPYLVRDFEVSYVPSASTFVAMRETKRRKRPENALDFYGFGHPFDRQAEKVELDGTAAKGAIEIVYRDRKPLLHAAEEVLSIAELFATGDDEVETIETSFDLISDNPETQSPKVALLRGERFRVALRTGAQEKLFKTDPDVRNARILHFCGHGEADLTSPVLSRLVFAQSAAIADKTDEDGYLYVNELADMRLNNELFVMSACSTNDGKRNVVEGVQGLAYAALRAGSRSVISTLWQVNDRHAKDFMVDFYQRYIGEKKSRSQALREAKLEAITKGMPMKTWAAYVLWDAE